MAALKRRFLEEAEEKGSGSWLLSEGGFPVWGLIAQGASGASASHSGRVCEVPGVQGCGRNGLLNWIWVGVPQHQLWL